MNLPNELEKILKPLLKDEWPDFISSFDKEVRPSIRVNRHKISVEELKTLLAKEYKSIKWEKIPWTEEGLFFSQDLVRGVDAKEDFFRPGQTYSYLAGLFYIQEASAMLPAQLLKLEPNSKVLDMCAAPGGKSIKIASDYQDCLVFSNDISLERAMILLRNVEQAGLDNVVVLHENPLRLKEKFKESMDAIILDTPCSGEGMIRRDRKALQSWSDYGYMECSKIQTDLLDLAYDILKPGGQLLYSTCTFNIFENELQIINFLSKHSDIEICKLPLTKDVKNLSEAELLEEKDFFDLLSIKEESKEKYKFWAEEIASKGRRIWPHKAEGDGHFVCLMRKKGILNSNKDLINFSKGKTLVKDKNDALKSEIKEAYLDFLRENTLIFAQNKDSFINEINFSKNLFFERNFLHETKIEAEVLKGLHVLKRGLLLGEVKNSQNLSISFKKNFKIDKVAKNKNNKKTKFIPSHAFALSRGSQIFKYQLNLSSKDERLSKYIRGESILAEVEELTLHLIAESHKEARSYLNTKNTPYVLITYEGFSLGLAKWQQGILKNLYPKSWVRN